MKKTFLLRGILGFPLGIALGHLITIFLSLGWGGGHYEPCMPEFTAAVGSESGAVAIQALLCGLLGAGFGAASGIWRIERWGLAKQAGIYFLAISFLMLPIAYLSHWMERSVAGFLHYFGIFFLIFSLIFLIQFLAGRHNVKRMNELLQKGKDGTP